MVPLNTNVSPPMYTASDDLVPDPVQRNLRIFALDPSLAAQYGTAGIGEITIAVP
jgi:hypothetical protein